MLNLSLQYLYKYFKPSYYQYISPNSQYISFHLEWSGLDNDYFGVETRVILNSEPNYTVGLYMEKLMKIFYQQIVCFVSIAFVKFGNMDIYATNSTVPWEARQVT